MLAHTKHRTLSRLVSLVASAVDLISRNRRTPFQIERLLNAFQRFKDGKDIEDRSEDVDRREDLFVVVKVGSTHAGALANRVLVLQLEDFPGKQILTEGGQVFFRPDKRGGASPCQILFFLSEDRSAVVRQASKGKLLT